MAKRKIMIFTTCVLSLTTLLLLGLTYAYYKTRIDGNTNEKSVSVVSKKLEVIYQNESAVINAEGIEPGYTATKTFEVKNTGSETVEYSVMLDNVTNTFTRTEDWTYTISENGTELKSGTLPKSTSYILYSESIDAGETKNYTLVINYANLKDVNQSEDMGKSLSFRINISEAATFQLEIADSFDENISQLNLLSSEHLLQDLVNGDYSIYKTYFNEFNTLDFATKQKTISYFTGYKDTGPNIKDGKGNILSNPYNNTDEWNIYLDWTLCDTSDDKCSQENVIGYWEYTYEYEGKEYELDNNTIKLKVYLLDTDGPVLAFDDKKYDGRTINMNNGDYEMWSNTFDNWDGSKSFDLETYLNDKGYPSYYELELVDSHNQTAITELHINYGCSGSVSLGLAFKYDDGGDEYLRISSGNCVTVTRDMFSFNVNGYKSSLSNIMISNQTLGSDGLCLTRGNYDVSVDVIIGNVPMCSGYAWFYVTN